MAVLLLGMFLPAGVRANAFFYQFTNVFSGLTPEGSPAWVSTLFSDAAPGTVQLKISADGLTGGEFLSAIFFNLDPSLKPTKLSFTYVTGSGGFALPTIADGANFVKADGQGKYDIEFTFSQKAATAFTGSDYVIYDITSTAYNLTAADFEFLSTAAGGCSQFYAAAEIADISGTCSSDTGWISPCQVTPVPEPRALTLFAFAACLATAIGWRRNRAKRA